MSKIILESPPYVLLEAKQGWGYAVQKDGQDIPTPKGKQRTWHSAQIAYSWIQLQHRLDYIQRFIDRLEEEMHAPPLPETQERRIRQQFAYDTLYSLLTAVSGDLNKEVRVRLERVLALCAQIEMPLSMVFGKQENNASR